MKDSLADSVRSKCHEFIDLVPASSLQTLIWLLHRLIAPSLNAQFLKEKKSR